jgi:hypothetical protein
MIMRWPDNQVIPQVTRLELIREQLQKIPGPRQEGIGPNAVVSFPDGIAQIIRMYLECDYPLANLPTGKNQIVPFLRHLAKMGSIEDQLAYCWGKTEDGQRVDIIDVTNIQVPDDTVVPPNTRLNPKTFKRKPGAQYDLCPRCGEPTFEIISGKCARCLNCYHKEC